MVPTILHIPHASTVLPDECRADFTVAGEVLERHVAVSTDHFTDELFALAGPDVATVAFPISRLAVDPERFDDDAREPMAARGLGVLYERGHDGTRIRQPMPAARRAWYLDRWYRPHHAALAHAVEQAVARAGHALIFDCHSFADAPLAVDLDQSTPRPDGCLGTSGVHTPTWLVDAGLRFAAQQGWSLGVDRPYSGAIVPLPHFGRDARVLSVMIEINRRRYMAIEGATAVKTNGFAATQRFVQGLMAAMRAAASANRPPSARLP